MSTRTNRLMALGFGAALGAALLGTSVIAATPPPPTMSGSYTVTGTVFCQTGSVSAKAGIYDTTVGTIAFYPTLGDIQMQQTQLFGSVTSDLPFSTLNKNYSYTYSNTVNTLTLNGLAYKVVYTNVQNGIAQSLSGVAIDSNGCARSFTMQIQSSTTT